ncbi:cytoskeletal protein CcmA (bactofilin family) [Fontibacillus phaseoli]|uniref:Cytoskeletal protein CcmA (Bactofilin family) n=1 Tax=Fontibacillus phaseoli TaxID=1416533 RepID=A0A369BGY2_9BACL|nr:polymer-forming cytoskeletal protein [Fontibacillus phaseoli]RCX20515.1 cytoskeletal protein CcmA (bactofilin family) [Fontibacillus phaseoli]
MFKNNKTVKLDPNSTDTLIGEGSIFEGKITSGAGVRIEGHIIGDIECEGDVTVGEKGDVKSNNIIARNVIIAGVVNGNVQARQKLSITSKGKLYGNISAVSLSIEEGSTFEGTSRMEGGSEPSAPIAVKESAAAAEPSSSAPDNHQKQENGATPYKAW